MLVHVIRKQMLEYFLSLRFLIGASLCLFVGIGATCIRTQAYRTALSDYRTNRGDHHLEAAAYTAPFPLTYSGVSIDRPPTLLGIFYRGLEPVHPVSARVTANRDPIVEAQYERANPISDLFQTVDFVSFTAVVLSLLALVFSYDTISGEKETGTLRLVLSFPLPRDSLLLGKWLGGYLALALPYLLTAGCCLSVVVLYPGADPGFADTAAFAALLGAGLLYLGCFYSLGLMVSALTSRAFTSITALIALWVGLGVALPNLSPYAARALLPVPGIQEIEREKWSATEEENLERGRKIRAYTQSTTDPEARQGVVISELFRESFTRIARRQEQIHAEYERGIDRQISAAVWLSRLSPTASLIYTGGELADTGIREARRFRKALQDYRIRFLNYAEDKWIERARQGGGDIATADYPRFTYVRPGPADRLGASLIDLGLLTFWNLLFFITAYVVFLRYDPR